MKQFYSYFKLLLCMWVMLPLLSCKDTEPLDKQIDLTTSGKWYFTAVSFENKDENGNTLYRTEYPQASGGRTQPVDSLAGLYHPHLLFESLEFLDNKKLTLNYIGNRNEFTLTYDIKEKNRIEIIFQEIRERRIRLEQLLLDRALTAREIQLLFEDDYFEYNIDENHLTMVKTTTIGKDYETTSLDPRIKYEIETWELKK